MPETEQIYLDIQTEGGQTQTGLRGVINYIREEATSQYRVGNEFERLIKRYLRVDPIYKRRFSDVWLWGEWTAGRTDFDATDIGIDLVAQERSGEYCAIQCKCYDTDKRVSKPDIDSFISASASDDFAKRILVHTGGELGRNVLRTIEPLGSDFQVISYGHLAARDIDWPDLRLEDPEQLEYRHKPFELRPHQQEALDDVVKGFQSLDRGKLIMACGTGKTFAALRIAEEIAGTGGRVLYLVPSIGLFSQAMREWAEQQGVSHRYIGICSDESAGRNTEDVPIQELEIPVTTDPLKISEVLQETDEETMTVVFCTYHSLPLVEQAQGEGAPEFNLILCDEAHRTTGVDAPGDDTSPFVLVHDGERILAEKRLYMTATPRLYTEGVKAKAAQHDIEVFSMDDPAVYGPEFHRLPFSKAVGKRLLSDYKVVILTMYEPDSDAALQGYVGAGGSEINISDATKIIGCWRALQNPEGETEARATIRPLTRAIAFNNTIRNSKRLVEHWNGVVESAAVQMPEDQRPLNFACETQHVDGQHNAFDRKNRIEWLKGDSEGHCRILSNARCLSEGIDVPALDAVMFMTPRNSHVDIVQAVGRVMRRADDKDYGYIILPVAIPPGTDPANALDNNERFAAVWGVLRALRSHDDRFNAEINKIDLNNSPTDRIIFGGGGNGNGDGPQVSIPFEPVEIAPHDIFAKIVEKCGDRKYWESWAKDVADIFQRVVVRINNLLANPENTALGDWFDDFHTELKETINDSITRDDAVEMMAQHILTRPVFEALFENYNFASGNPVARALENLKSDFGEFGLKEETRDLEGFYESVRMRAQGIDNSEGRQKVLLELYEKFFANALKKDAERLGIVYTPVEVVDFILHSADEVLREEFGRSLSDEGVHILDPFAGAGVFLSRLLQSHLIKDSNLERKYREELHANEIVLLAYYIAAVNIEEAYRGRRSEECNYEAFNGIVLTDTFNLNEWEPNLRYAWMPDNNARAEHQQKLPIQVIVGNPPWSAGQKSALDNNANVKYPALAARVEKTYAEGLDRSNTRHLYDTYKLAIRWASDRINERGQERGVVAFVTNASWIEGNVDAGIRACLEKEFSSIYVLHLRGDANTSGKRRQSEGDNVFDQGSKSPVAITILVKNSNPNDAGCRILYRDIGDFQKKEAKLDALGKAVSISGFSDWKTIMPNRYHDWIGQRGERFDDFLPLGSKGAKAGKTQDAIFQLFSLGLLTSRDDYIYNFSHTACADYAERMTHEYMDALQELKENRGLTPDEAVRRHTKHISWAGNLKDKLRQMKPAQFGSAHIRRVTRRPFVTVNGYVDDIFIHRKHQLDRILPNNSTKNRMICVSGIGSKIGFSALMVDTIPDYQLIFNGQNFPRYHYAKSTKKSNPADGLPGMSKLDDRIDNIPDTALHAFQDHYRDEEITRDVIFDYVYGILNAPSYQEEFADYLSKEIPCIPFAPNLDAFAQAGKALGELHLGYETCERYPLKVVFTHEGEPNARHFRLTEKAMRFADDEKTTLIINEHVSLSGIPEEAHRYVVNGRTPLEWYIDRYRIKRDKESGIVNDPNGWFEDPRDLVAAIERIIFVSVESARIIEGLPSEVTGEVQG